MAESPAPITILIAAGGTGGHLFPARHIANAFLQNNQRNRIEFIGTGRELEARIIDKAGFERHVLKTAGIKGRGIAGLFQFLVCLPTTIRVTRELLDKVRPDLVIGVGGYVTVFPVLMASRRKIPTIIHEAEIRPGLANKLLARFARRVTVSFEDATIRPRSKVVVTGQPVRPEMKRFLDMAPHIPERIQNILVVGGSLGAQGIDDAMTELAPFLFGKGLRVVHQTRPENSARVSSDYQRSNLHATVVNFIENIDEAYMKADIIISRSGASTVMELSIVNRPVIFVPYPFSQGDHQTNNARVLSTRGKALIVSEGDSFASRLRANIEHLLVPKNYEKMVKAPSLQRNIDGAQRIVAEALKLVSGD